MSTSVVTTITFLFTDIAGSTRLWAEHREAMGGAIARHDALLRSAVEEHGGTVFKTVGDAVCAAFPAPLGALAAALAGQRALAAETWAGVPPLRVRMAIHSGVAERRDDDYFGQAVNRVARLLAIGHGGQVLLSRASEELVADLLPDEVVLRDLGQHRLKDLARPERVFQVLAPGLAVDFPPLASLDRRPNNLPVQPTPLLGRDEELAAVARLLADSRLVTLVGPGGIGKTRLALQVAADAADAFRHGVWFVDLAPLADADLVVATAARALGLAEVPGEAILDTLKAWLAEKQLLLVLDNFEQVLSAAADAASLLAAAPDVRVLATSRAPLRVRGEQEYPVGPLPLPDPAHGLGVDQLSQFAALQLFVHRAMEVRPDFAVTTDNAPAIAAICTRLDGLPLAIELAAARTKLLSPAALLQRLEQRLTVLTGGARDLPERQQTMRAAIAWSYDLLEPGEQRLFRRLAVFAGGGTFAAAEAVCTGTDAAGIDVFDGIASLVDKSLVRQLEPPDGEPRLVMLETIREFGLGQLAEAGELAAAGAAHFAYFASLASAARPELAGPRQVAALRALMAERDNLRAALQWSAEHDPAAGLRMAADLERYWWAGGHLSEGGEWLDALLARCTGATPIRAAGLAAAGRVAYERGEFRVAEGYYRNAAELYRAVGDDVGAALSLGYLAWQLERQGRYSELETAVAVAEAAAGATDDPEAQLIALLPRYILAANRGDFEAAVAINRRAVEYYQQRGDVLNVPASLNGVGFSLVLAGRPTEAIPVLEEAALLFGALGPNKEYANTLDSLGRAYLAVGDTATAVATHHRGIRMAHALGIRQELFWNLEGLAFAARRQRAPRCAATLLGAAAAIRDAVGAPVAEYERAHYDTEVAVLATALGQVGLDAAWAAGQVMGVEAAVAYALEVRTDG